MARVDEVGARHVSVRSVPPSTDLLRTPDDGQTFCVSWSDSPAYTSGRQDIVPCGQMRVLHHDASVVVIDKPAFLPTENTRDIKDSVRSRVERLAPSADVRVPHRLDWETSGLMVFALGAEAMRSLSCQFAEHTIDKAYTADVVGMPPAPCGTVHLPLSADPDRRPRQRVDFGTSGKAATTAWTVEGSTPHACRLRLTPESGRRHQLRMHCLALGCPIAGDGLYLRPDPDACRPTRLHLHASMLGFTHPSTGEAMAFHSKAPFGLNEADSAGPSLPRPLPAPVMPVDSRKPRSSPTSLTASELSPSHDAGGRLARLTPTLLLGHHSTTAPLDAASLRQLSRPSPGTAAPAHVHVLVLDAAEPPPLPDLSVAATLMHISPLEGDGAGERRAWLRRVAALIDEACTSGGAAILCSTRAAAHGGAAGLAAAFWLVTRGVAPSLLHALQLTGLQPKPGALASLLATELEVGPRTPMPIAHAHPIPVRTHAPCRMIHARCHRPCGSPCRLPNPMCACPCPCRPAAASHRTSPLSAATGVSARGR